MPRHTVALLLAAVLSIGFGAAASPVRAETVRVFLVGHKQRLEDATSVARFRAKMFALEDDREGALRVYTAYRRCGAPPAALPVRR